MRRPSVPVIVACVTMLAAACAGGSDTTDGPSTTAAEPSSSTAPTIRELPVDAVPTAVEDVEFTTADGLTLHGSLYPGNRIGVVAVHWWDKTNGVGRENIIPMVEPLAAGGGYTTLAFDLRGHGTSDGDPDAKGMPADIEAAVLFMATQPVDEVWIVGWAHGATGAIEYAAGGGDAAGLVNLFTYPQHLGLDAMTAASAVGIPQLFIATHTGLTERWAKRIIERSAGPTDLEVFPAPPTGSTVFDAYGPRMLGRIADFIDNA